MDGAKGSQTYQYMRGIDRGRGSRVGAVKAHKPRWFLDRGQESVCVCVVVDGLEYMRCECKSMGSYMSNTCKKKKSFCG